jgi:tyrosyl-DNA phosphodiesterase-1
MLILFRHDDTAQIIIHTANMIRRDWANMTQAVWASPQLPLLSQIPSSQQDTATHPIGSGKRFKVDLLKYLSAYERRSKDLIKQLNDYDFSSIRAAFIGSAPSRQKPAAATPSKTTSFGWLGLQEILSNVPILRPEGDSSPHIVTQISSIATLGAAPTWLSHFQSILERHSTSKASIPANPPVSFTKASAFFTKPEPSVNQKSPPAKHSIIFPTPEEIRTSLDGYASGGSIHWKLASAQQQKQLVYMHPMLCHWNPPSAPTHTPNAHRGPAAPHIKTYMRFSNQDHKTIDWAMVTSANFSKQAWGDVVNKKEEIWIQSWETGVVVWPALFAEANEEHVAMVPVFGQDLPRCADDVVVGRGEGEKEEEEYARRNILVGFRMPYNVPLVPYAAEEKPWCATMQYREPDRFGRVWNGY